MKSFSENEIVESGVRNPDDIVKSNLEYVSRAQASALERKFSHIKDRAGIIASEIKKSYDGRAPKNLRKYTKAKKAEREIFISISTRRTQKKRNFSGKHTRKRITCICANVLRILTATPIQ